MSRESIGRAKTYPLRPQCQSPNVSGLLKAPRCALCKRPAIKGRKYCKHHGKSGAK